MSDEYARAGVDEYDVQGTPPGDLGYPDRCNTCGGTPEEPRLCPLDHDHGAEQFQACVDCTDTIHDRAQPSMTDEQYSEYLGTHYGGREDG